MNPPDKPLKPSPQQYKSPSTPKARTITITTNAAGQRLDNFLKHILKGVPPSFIYKIIRRGEVRVNSGRCKAATKLQLGDAVRIPPLRSATTAQQSDVPAWLQQSLSGVIYEDQDLLAINKPSGVAVHGGSGLKFGVIEALRRIHTDYPYLELAHRLDRATSGCLLLAKSRTALLGLHQQFSRESVGLSKRYTALLAGNMPEDVYNVEIKLSKKRHAQSQVAYMGADHNGRYACSVITVLQRYRCCSLVEVELKTGRMHQIRAHCAAIGFPVLGDDLYAKRENIGDSIVGLTRMFLHAAHLRFTHPISGKTIHLSAPLPHELQLVLQNLGKTS